jgi:hypothetical protein
MKSHTLPPEYAPKLKMDVMRSVLLTIITCGVYSLVWKHRQLRCVNTLIESDKYNFPKWLALSTITCGLYNFYHIYVLARDIIRLEEAYQIPCDKSLPTVSLVISLLGLWIVCEAIMQKELNTVIDKACGLGSIN